MSSATTTKPVNPYYIKKRKRCEDEVCDTRPIAATTFELWDVDCLDVIKELKMTEPEVEAAVERIIIDSNRTKRRVDYRAKEYADGRVYGEGYQTVPG